MSARSALTSARSAACAVSLFLTSRRRNPAMMPGRTTTAASANETAAPSSTDGEARRLRTGRSCVVSKSPGAAPAGDAL